MSGHSRVPKWAATETNISYKHCRRPGCGAKPFVPSKHDPAMCEACADEYITRGLRYCRIGRHWRPVAEMVPRYARCKACRAAERRAAYSGSGEQQARRAYYEAHREQEIAYAKAYHRKTRRAYEYHRYHSDPEWRAKKLARNAARRAGHPEPAGARKMRKLRAVQRGERGGR